MANITIQDRAIGAIMGAYIGDALGLGPHWYYNLDELRQQYGPWINDYTDPQADRYHGGMKAGQQSQSGLILNLQTPLKIIKYLPSSVSLKLVIFPAHPIL